MIGFFDRLARPLLRALEPENAHALTLNALKFALTRPPPTIRGWRRGYSASISRIRSGLPPGFDKNAEVPDALLSLGFGFVEVGTVTPRPQGGNPRPRVFRLETDEGVINRLGFNSAGASVVLARLAARAEAGGIVGVNIGANRDSSDRTADYIQSDRKIGAGRKLHHCQRLIAQHARPARSPAGVRARRSARAHRGGAQSRAAASRPHAGAAQDRARSLAYRSRRRGRHRARPPCRRHDRYATPRSRGRRHCAMARRRSRPADSPAGRCSRFQPACWRKPMCGSKVRSR